jgi:2-methylaconitate cis-trans-isomerase PrpF
VLKAIPCTLMRGGTSKGPFFLAEDLPADPAARDAVPIAALGAGHPLQIDGVGGGNPVASKVAIVSRAADPGWDVDYLFAQVSVDRRAVDTSPNCGNMLVGVGPFAIEKGLVTARKFETLVRVRNVNVGQRVDVVVRTPGGRVEYDGDCAIDGVPGTAAPVGLTFLDDSPPGAARSFLPTGNPADLIAGIEATCVSGAMPMVVARAESFGKTAHETAAKLDATRRFSRGWRRSAARPGAGWAWAMSPARSCPNPRWSPARGTAGISPRAISCPGSAIPLWRRPGR